MRVLGSYKYPEIGLPRARYYRDARDTIRNFHRQGGDGSTLREAVADLQLEQAHASEYETIRLRHNARVLRAYLRHRADRDYELRQVAYSSLSVSGVTVNTNPDLYVTEAGRPRLVKFDFATACPEDEFARIIVECLARGAQAARVEVTPKDVVLYSIEHDREWKATRPGVRRWNNIKAACRQIATLWPSV
jgi:hypothetical protein